MYIGAHTLLTTSTLVQWWRAGEMVARRLEWKFSIAMEGS